MIALNYPLIAAGFLLLSFTTTVILAFVFHWLAELQTPSIPITRDNPESENHE